jgi:hypothetical protein
MESRGHNSLPKAKTSNLIDIYAKPKTVVFLVELKRKIISNLVRSLFKCITETD